MLGPWRLSSTALYRGAGVLGKSGKTNIYLGNDGISFGNELVYNASTGHLDLRVNSLQVVGKTLYEEIMGDGSRMYYTNATPTMNNYPANEWDSTDGYVEHVGDICYDTVNGKMYQLVRKSDANQKYQITFDSNT